MAAAHGICLVYACDGLDQDAVFAGRSLVERAAAVAAAAGLEALFVMRPGSAACAPPGTRCVAPGGRLPSGLASAAPVVLLRCDVAFSPGVLRDLVASPLGCATLEDDTRRVAAVRLPAARVGIALPSSVDSVAAGASALRRRDGSRPGDVISLARAARGDGAPGTPSPSLRDEERRLIRALDNARDGAVDRALNRRVSWAITRALLPHAVTPNQVTFASVALGVLAAVAIARPGIAWPVCGALLLQLSAILDCVDGEIARAKVLESRAGAWFDVTADTLIHIATFAGIAVHAWPWLGSALSWSLGASFATGGLASFAVVTRAENSESRWRAVDSWQGRLLAQLLAALTTRDVSVLLLAAAATGALDWLLVGSAIGAQAFWVAAAWLHRGALRRALEGGVALPAASREPSRRAG